MFAYVLHTIEQIADYCWSVFPEACLAATLILSIAALANLSLCRLSAALRHRVWSLAALGLLAFPVLGITLPRFHFDYGKLFAASEVAQTEIAHQAEPAAYGGMDFRPMMGESEYVLAQPPPMPHPSISRVSIETPDVEEPAFYLKLGDVPWKEVILALWAIGMALGIGSYARSLQGARLLLKNSVLCGDSVWLDMADDIGSQLGLRSNVKIAFSRETASPLMLGWLRPTILLPAHCEKWPHAQRLTVLVHEMSHIARRDIFWQEMARAAGILYWFHPLMWLALRRMRVERELACDDAVINFGERPSNYAALLLEVAAAITGRTKRLHGGMAMACRSSVERRIAAMLNPNRIHTPLGRRASWAMFAAAICIVALGAMFNPIERRQPAEAHSDYAADVNESPPQNNMKNKGDIPARTLTFPDDRSLGKLLMRDDNISDEPYRHLARGNWKFTGQAKGAVDVPAGKHLRLEIAEDALKDLSPLADIGPNDLRQLLIRNGKPNNKIMVHISRFTGLKELSLDAPISDDDMSHLSNFKSLEYMIPPQNISDKGLSALSKLPSLKGLYFKNSDKITSKDLQILAKIKSLEELTFAGGTFNDADLAHLANLLKLNAFSLWGNDLNGSGLGHLKNAKSLKVVHLDRMPHLTDDSLKYLAALPNLETLSLNMDPLISDNGMALLARSRSLRKLDIKDSQVTSRGVAQLANIKTLEYLTLPESCNTPGTLSAVGRMTNLKSLLFNTPYYTDPNRYNGYYSAKELAALDALKKLEELTISGPGVDDESVKHIAKLTHLKTLKIRVSALGNPGLMELSKLQSLEQLDLRWNRVTLGGLSALNNLPRLKDLRAWQIIDDGMAMDIGRCTELETFLLNVENGNTIDDADLACLKNLKKLNNLQTGISTVGDAGLEHISGLPELSFLITGGMNVTDAGLKHLSNLKNLHRLDIYGSISDAGLRDLEKLSGLTALNIHSTQNISPEAIEKLKKALPDEVEINVDADRRFPNQP